MGAVSTSKKSSAGKNVLVFFIVFIILEMLIIFGIGKVFKNKDVTPNVMGYSLFMTSEDLVQNGPDGATVAVPKNVLVIASNGLPDPTNKIGCAILCENIDGVGSGVYWLADMTENKDKTGVDYTVTNGTQSHVIKSTNIVGVCASYFVTAGKVINFVTQKFGMICCAVVPLFLLVLIELIIAIATHSSDDDEDDDDEDEDDEEKTVELDDFLFGGQSEGEQIAKRRRKAKAAMEEGEDADESKNAEKKPEAEDKPEESAKDDNDEFDFDMKQPSVKEREAAAKAAAEEEAPAPVVEEAPAPAAEEVKEESAEKAPEPAAEAAAAAAEETPEAAPEKRPARRQGARPSSARRRRSAGSSVTSDASLEDLMKLMEEEQNKLRNKLN